jgi:thiamine pyrophosphokinase
LLAMRVIIFANGQFPDPSGHRHLIQSDDLVIGVDGGALHARAVGAWPHVVIGDLDSLEPRLQAELEADGTQFLSYPPEKDETDLELALLYGVERGAEEIIILAALGDRLDQEVANLLLMTHPALADTKVKVVERNQVVFIIRDQATIEGRSGDTVSLIPLSGDAEGVTTEGLKWELHEETLRFGLARGVSNVLLGGEARVSVREGILLCVVIHGHTDSGEEV